MRTSTLRELRKQAYSHFRISAGDEREALLYKACMNTVDFLEKGKKKAHN